MNLNVFFFIWRTGFLLVHELLQWKKWLEGIGSV